MQLPWTAAHQASLSFTISWSLLRFTSLETVMLSNHVMPCHPLLRCLQCFPAFRVFSSESALHIRWPKYWSFNFSLSPFNEYSGLIFLRIDWFDLLAVQVTRKSLFQHHNSKVSILQLSVFVMGPTLKFIHDNWKKTLALTIWTFVSQVMSLLFNMLFRFVTAFCPSVF